MSAAASGDYWDRVAETAVFSLPLDIDALRRLATPDARILDYGCGYGRQLSELVRLGYTRVAGIDPASAMVARARRELPGVDIDVCDAPPCRHPDASFDVVLLSAVLTCVPDDAEQSKLVAEIRRLLRPGGVLLLSDFLFHSDARNRARYLAGRETSRRFGCFEGPGGAVMRHHDPAYLLELTRCFVPERIAPFAARTMNGNPATGVLLVARKPVVEATADAWG